MADRTYPALAFWAVPLRRRVRPQRHMDEGARRWLKRYASDNLWRVSAWVDYDDMVQEGYYAWLYVLDHYPDVKDPPHLMRLFQLTFRSVIENLVKKKRRQLDVCVGDLLVLPDNSHYFTLHDQFLEEKAGPAVDISTISLTIENAPLAVRKVLEVLVDEKLLMALREPYKRRKDGTRETLNQRLCRLTGYDPSMINLPALFNAYFTHQME